MNVKFSFAAAITAVWLTTGSYSTQAETLDDDFATICGWYKSLASEDKYKGFTTENKFTYVFDPKTQSGINNLQLKSFYAALRATQASQRYEFIKAYAEGTLGKNWECPPMQQIMDEFNTLDPYFQYAK